MDVQPELFEQVFDDVVEECGTMFTMSIEVSHS